MELLSTLTDGNVGNFLLLLLRFAGVFTFFPFFDNQLVPISVRGALTFFMTVLFFPLLPHPAFNFTIDTFLIAGAMEILLGFVASLALQIVFGAISFAGDSISFSMGLTMASAYDPMSGSQKPIVGQAISLLAIVIALSANFHHFVLMFVAHTLSSIPLGGFVLSNDIVSYLTKAFTDMFLIGFAMAFPILGLVLLSDIIFGMIMKTHPQFNLLAIGFPVKIGIALVVIILIIPAIMIRFKDELNLAFLALKKLF
ncbi:flagellar biosynthetic protein FliR [Helicobacter cappadocius]|uniref:Flagellar biosynthetic protein FliR n=1 Tax=Helicobacter cappadocius TaxID=3063998 RepID=A0AA90PQR3_9HELI|nr:MULTISPECIES: flagellar biosynthetic protein FliR [unclassified Helicobacter]MDO7253262.1 flagellar biosynthetic protein FliR [Helicobacter sp. faydin-H75]MDP2539186.1 flagellar biosynthetic protein FliR [Helicobacter sp. faydin-H76]